MSENDNGNNNKFDLDSEDFILDHNNDPEIEPEQEVATKPQGDDAQIAKRNAARESLKGAIGKFFASNPMLKIEGFDEDFTHALQVIETIGNVRIKEHGKIPGHVVAFDRKTGQPVKFESALEGVYTAIPGFRERATEFAEKQALQAELGISDKPRNESGQFARNDGPTGPSASFMPGLEVDPALQPEEVVKARRELLKYFGPDGQPKVSPMADKRFEQLLYAANWEQYSVGQIVPEIEAAFRLNTATNKAKSLTREQIVALSDEEFKDLTKFGNVKTLLQEKVAAGRPGEGWGRILAERDAASRRARTNDPDHGTIYEKVKDPDVRHIMKTQHINEEFATKWVENARRNGWRIR